jgi:hypothetical protein
MGLREHLAENLKRLMDSPTSRYRTAQSIQDASARLQCKIGRSTVQRIRDAATPVNLDYVEALARVFNAEPWQLLRPPGDDAAETPIAIEAALPVVLDALAASPARAELRQLLPVLVDTDAPAYRQRLMELLSSPAVGAALPNPAAPERQHELDELSREAEEMHAAKFKGRRASRG